MSSSLERSTSPNDTPVAGRRRAQWRPDAPGSKLAPLPGIGLPGLAPPVRAELAALLATLMLLIDEQGAIVLHVTSATAAAGASSVAAEIAAAAASSGWCKVALVDAHAATGDGRIADTGLLDTVERGEAPVLRQGRVGGVAMALGSFNYGGNVMARIDGLRDLYGQLRAGYTLVLVDGPPVLSGASAAVLGADADASIIVVEAERTRVSDVTRARTMLEQVGAPLLGIVLNKSRSRIPGLVRRFL